MFYKTKPLIIKMKMYLV